MSLKSANIIPYIIKKKRQSPRPKAAKRKKGGGSASRRPRAVKRKISRPKKAVSRKRRTKPKAAKTAAVPRRGREKSKRSTYAAEANRDLPFSYNKTKIVMLARDPEWAFTYWDFSADTWQWLQGLFAEDPSLSPKLRVHNLSESTHYDIDILLEAKNWYLHLHPAMTYELELGLMDRNGKFISIVRSNRVIMPRIGPSSVVDPKWNADYSEALCRGGMSGSGPGGLSSGRPTSQMKRQPSSIPTNVFS